MNEITKSPVGSLGYDFIPAEHLPKGKNEYYLRNQQNRSGITYRELTAYEIEVLVRNRNTSDDWNKVLVSDAFAPELVKNCKFFGLVRIGKLEPFYLSFHGIRLPVGLYDSTIISCDLGDNVVVSNVNYMSHYIIGNEVIIVNVNELVTTDHAKFGNGILKTGEKENGRIWLEVCNENAGRSIIPFNGMLAGDAYLWATMRDDDMLLQKFKEFTEREFDTQRGYYGHVGDRTIIKNSRIIKDVWIGSDAYIKGANKLKNLTINSSPEAKSQIGEGCEMVNGIMGYGCRAFYGVKAVRFIMSSNSQLKYGARLINSFLGDNATISCCEVLNSLIFPAHEQHHNNSFLCAALVLGQSNIAAGATIGSNHNSRAPDGEMNTGRGFWPGLCVSLKHNSKFATYSLVAKGDYPAELYIPFPFSLISNDVGHDRLVVMPCYWFMYNMYAIARNAHKYVDRDRRIEKIQSIEYEFLAPDSINEMFASLDMLKTFVGKAFSIAAGKKWSDAEIHKKGESLLETKTLGDLEVLAEGFENSKRKVVIAKAEQAYGIYQELIRYYGTLQLISFIERNQVKSFITLSQALPSRVSRDTWNNVGGQLFPQASLDSLVRQIHGGRIRSWKAVHEFYRKNGEIYPEQKFQHAFASLCEIEGITPKKFDRKILRSLLEKAVATKEWITKAIYDSRAKDYHNEFRRMMYHSDEEMEKVIGKLEDNTFINLQLDELRKFKRQINRILKQLKL